jgi:uncharacterized membrane protein YdjX (TVP38/TMEM64 family)
MDIMNNRIQAVRTRFTSWFGSLPLVQQIGVVIGIIIGVSTNVYILSHYQNIIEYIVNVSEQIRESGIKGKMVFVLLFSIVSFPPLIGFSSLILIVGIIYGYEGFWMIAITSSVMSTVSLCTFKYGLKDMSRRIIDSNEKLQLFVSVIKDEETTFGQEVFILLLMKLCPLPYSLTNGGLGCVPHLSPLAFFLACVICSPKYLIQIFMGIQLGKMGSIDKTGTKHMIDLIIFLVTGVSSGILSYMLYQRLQVKIRQRNENIDATGLNLNDTVRDTSPPPTVSLTPPPYEP